MIWADCFPFVLPGVIGCTYPLAELHLRQAAIEFCRRTGCYVRALDPILAHGFPEPLELDLPNQTQAVKLMAVSVNGLDHAVVDAHQGEQMIRQGNGQSFCFTTDKKTLTFSPALPAKDVVVATMALAPSHTATGIDDDVAGPYVAEIASGALAALYMIPLQPWSDVQQSAAHRAIFGSRIATVAAHFSRGQASTKSRNFKTYF